ncbi:hypothetical protein CAPTEDRAFT_219110 [Capitella teleta]|uniref:Arrestin C-terminal-like domain-containing protein n=1 Tax=Capitella teleta TaxID=283909 RepID=R7VAG3_CAPTE|nr:hypothetical protein CAPTEDRAFT_219110 [Capitella teleta]|eukprot:ELU15532.1 hypothetical protein CAPTEDRAFT_219110 [Capitella teleta]
MQGGAPGLKRRKIIIGQKEEVRQWAFGCYFSGCISDELQRRQKFSSGESCAINNAAAPPPAIVAISDSSVHLWVLGQSDVSWSDKPGGRRNHFEYEIYMKDCLILWGRDPRDKPAVNGNVLQAGAHEYQFQYVLPKSLPSSFESQDVQFKGRVHYILRAKLDTPDESVRSNSDRIFLVLSVMDLNKEHSAGESVQLRREKQMCCCCCKSGPISCVLRLDRTGYVPGEDINLDAELSNMSRKEVAASYVTMQQIVHYHAHGISRMTSSDIFRISGGKIKCGDNAFYHDIIHIPPLPPSRLDGCRLIDIDYVITIGVQPTGNGAAVEVNVPIVIGTVPLNFVVPQGLSVSPSFSRYSHSSGEIEDYGAQDFERGKFQHVYTYYKSLYKRAETMSITEVT